MPQPFPFPSAFPSKPGSDGKPVRKPWLSRRARRSLKFYALGAGVMFAGIQFARPAKNLQPLPVDGDFFAHFPASDEVRKIVKSSCYDCHTAHTNYPWYAEVQPVGWWLNTHIRAGNRQFNFAKMADYPPVRASTRFQQIAVAVYEARMPLPSYAWGHPEAKLTPGQRKLVVDWAVEHGERLDKEAQAQRESARTAVREKRISEAAAAAAAVVNTPSPATAGPASSDTTPAATATPAP